MHDMIIYQNGCVNYDSLFKSVIDKDIEEQIKNIIADAYERLSIVSVQQQSNGSYCGLWCLYFSIAYASFLVLKEAPETFQ